MVIKLSRLLTDFTIRFIENNYNQSEEELLKIKYGIEGIYLTLVKMIIILAIGIIFKYFDTLILTLVFFNILRFFAFGLHAKKSWHCLIISLIQFNLIPYLLLQIDIPIWFYYFVFIESLISFVLFAPSDTEKRPLTNKKKRLIRKILSIICVFIYSIIAYKISYLRIPIICSLLIESSVINPFNYRLLGLNYNNYKKVNLA